MLGRISGSVTNQKRCRALAPSTAAASSTSFDREPSAAMKISATQDTFFQTVSTITETRAMAGSLSQRTSSSTRPASSSMKFSRPDCSQ